MADTKIHVDETATEDMNDDGYGDSNYVFTGYKVLPIRLVLSSLAPLARRLPQTAALP